MTEKEYLAHLASELRKKGVADCEEIVSEYEQHFAFKRADGFSEEEIAAKLGSPASVAAQFERGEKEGKEAGSGFIRRRWVCRLPRLIIFCFWPGLSLAGGGGGSLRRGRLYRFNLPA